MVPSIERKGTRSSSSQGKNIIYTLIVTVNEYILSQLLLLLKHSEKYTVSIADLTAILE